MERRVTLKYKEDMSQHPRVSVDLVDPRSKPKTNSEFPSLEEVKRGGHLMVHLSASCICNRPKKMIICNYCRFQSKGRARKHCFTHPNTIFLMDFDHCPKCLSKSSALTEYSDDESQP